MYVSAKDKRVELIADEGIDAKAPPGPRIGVVNNLVDAMKKGRTADSIVAAIHGCGRELALHFLPREENLNELPDAVTEIRTHDQPY